MCHDKKIGMSKKCVEKNIERIKIVEKIKYLGLNICDEKDIFGIQKK